MNGSIIYLLFLSLLINISFFLVAFRGKTDKFTDLIYGLSFIILSWVAFFKNGLFYWYQLVIVAMVTIWAVRLAGYLFVRITKIKKDSRFDEIRTNPLKFFKFWLLQGVSVWLVMLPATAVLFSTKKLQLNAVAVLGLFLWLIGLVIETIADSQKFRFKNNPKNNEKWIQSGLWRYSRHPNYFGEITLWWGVYVFSVSLLPEIWPTIIGPLYISFLILFVSGVPTVEKRMDKKFAKNKNYWQYKKTTSAIILWPKKLLFKN
jgi:steroid 5-alpha reductase family enzyme